MTTQPEPDHTDIEAFLGRVLSDSSRLAVTLMACLGERLGLFHNLAHGPATSAQLAARAEVNERATHAWLLAMASSGYVRHDPANGQFSLPAAHIPVLAQQESPFFCGGTYHWLASLVGHYPRLVQAFGQGTGAPPPAEGSRIREGREHLIPRTLAQLLVQEVLPVLPEVQARLEQGCPIAQVGCGRGRTLLALALAYPQARFIGYDTRNTALEHATHQAQMAGVAERVRFQRMDANAGLSDTYKVITSFDVIREAANPRELLRAIREALQPDGRYVCLELGVAESVEQSAGPFGTLFYSLSVLSGLTISLVDGDEELGNMGISEAELRHACLDAGFSRVQRLPIENPFTNAYEIFP